MTKALEATAHKFAEEIKLTIVKAFPVKTTNLDVRLSEKGGMGRVVLETSKPIELSCDIHSLLDLDVKCHFALNGTHSYLKPGEFQGFHNVIELGCLSICGVGRRHSSWRIRMRYAERKGKMVGMYASQNLSESVLSTTRPIWVGLVAAIDGRVRRQP